MMFPHIFTGKVIEPFFQEAITKLESSEKVDNLQIHKVENKYFGGNVSIAGLLTLGDLYDKFQELKAQKCKIDSIFITQSMLSRGGYDLRGIHINEFRALTGVPVFAIAFVVVRRKNEKKFRFNPYVGAGSFVFCFL